MIVIALSEIVYYSMDNDNYEGKNCSPKWARSII